VTDWTVQSTKEFDRAIAKLDRHDSQRLLSYLLEVVASGDPRSRGRGLSINRAGYWRYRIGDFRVICRIEDRRMTVIALDVGHRSSIYRD
jgi:mRNA interferase RelE/StbE